MHYELNLLIDRFTDGEMVRQTIPNYNKAHIFSNIVDKECLFTNRGFVGLVSMRPVCLLMYTI